MVAETISGMRLIPFSVNENENYLLAVTSGHINIFYNGVKIQDILSPWGDADLNKLQYAQRFGTIIFVHQNYKPQILKKGVSTFELSLFGFSSNDDMTVNIPFMKFDDADGVQSRPVRWVIHMPLLPPTKVFGPVVMLMDVYI
jgi:hypothetical protein